MDLFSQRTDSAHTLHAHWYNELEFGCMCES